MPVYLVTPLAQNFDIVKENTLKAIPETEIFELPNKAGLLVSYKGASFELSNAIGATSAQKEVGPRTGAVMVTSIGSYFGFGSTMMWEWLKTRLES